MSKKSDELVEVLDFDTAAFLKDEETIAAYLNAAKETGDPEFLLMALSNVARARSMRTVAQDAGLGRESLYKALRPGAKPRYDTFMRVVSALGIEIVFKPTHPRRRSPRRPAQAAQR